MSGHIHKVRPCKESRYGNKKGKKAGISGFLPLFVFFASPFIPIREADFKNVS
jgi:hypothetical protein